MAGMNSRERLLRVLSGTGGSAPPRYESEFPEDTAREWRRQGLPAGVAPEEYFNLDPRENLPVQWRRMGRGKFILRNEKDLARFRRAYNPASRGRMPRNWKGKVKEWAEREHALSVSPWNEGLLQVIGIGDWASLADAFFAMHDQPAVVEAAMDHYAGYLEGLLDRVLEGVSVDYSVFYSPIASNHAPVVSPETYARFAIPALRRVVERLERHGVRYHFIWASGQIRPLIPLWLDAGINGFVIRQVRETGLTYSRIRGEFGRDVRFFGGIDWRSIVAGRDSTDRELESTVLPLLDEGRYVPHLDDTVRAQIPFADYAYYRERLNGILARFGSG
jgi:uroporphyrinogen decarboxylase